ncbi:polysaccharide pyruvyl transferase family protein [Microlunatus sp. Y2014]|uniref:polysaccharide pyruvyl transferase family protein n=1 Tax=Microlunatus sp. Y2014 TaxID=3418488 RepID=UPI003DA6E295
MQRTRTVAEVLNELVAEEVHATYVLAPGNAGDCLISAGFFSLADQLGLSYEVVAPSDPIPADATTVFAGGGGIAPEWSSDYKSRIEVQAQTGSPVIVMPVSVRGNESFLAGLGSNVTLFLREQRSYEHAVQHATNGCEVLVDHDTAFHLDAREYLRTYVVIDHHVNLAPKELVRRALYVFAYTLALTKRTIAAFRVDAEANAAVKVPRHLWTDLSVISFFGWATKAECAYTTYQFLRLLDRYDVIATDRLHVAVGAALLGKHVELYDNSYFKCRAIHEMSMREYDVRMRTFA